MNLLQLHLSVLDPNSSISGRRNGAPATNLPPRLGLRRHKTRAVVEVKVEVAGGGGSVVVVVAAVGLNDREINMV